MKVAIKVGENTFWQVASKITNALTGLVIIGAIQRLYGDTGVGIYTVIIAYISFYFMPVDFGLNAIAVKHLLDKNYNNQHVFRNILGFRLVLSLILILIAILISQLLPYDPITNVGFSNLIKTGIILSALTILAQALLASANAYFQSIENYRYSFASNFLSAASNILIFLYLLNQGQPIHIAIIALTISGLLGGVTAVVLVGRKTGNIWPLLNRGYLKKIIIDTLPLTISLVLNLIYFRIDSLLLPFYRSIEEVGRYNIAYKIFDTILVIPNYFANALYPVLLNKYNQGQAVFIKTVQKSAAGLTVIAILGSLASYVLAPLGVQIITGTQNPETIFYTRILTSGLIFFFLSSIAMWSLIVIGKQKYLAYIYGSTMILNLFLNLLYIPQFGATASAIITLITELLVLLLSGSLLIKEIRKLKQE